MIILEHNVETGEVTEREATVIELEQKQKDTLEFESRFKEENERQERKNAVGAKLEKLGLTIDDLKVLNLG